MRISVARATPKSQTHAYVRTVYRKFVDLYTAFPQPVVSMDTAGAHGVTPGCCLKSCQIRSRKATCLANDRATACHRKRDRTPSASACDQVARTHAFYHARPHPTDSSRQESPPAVSWLTQTSEISPAITPPARWSGLIDWARQYRTITFYRSTLLAPLEMRSGGI